MKRIPLTQGKFAEVDDEDFERLNKWKWSAHKRVLKARIVWYAVRLVYRRGKSPISILMHREILGLSDPKITGDHWNHNGLDNQRKNLRIATQAQQNQNRRKDLGLTSQFKGVSWNKKKRRWNVQITVNGRKIRLGLFRSELKAASVYRKVAKRVFGEFACLE